jgi:hypothetical protein
MIQPLDLISASILTGFVVVGAVRGLFLNSLWLLGLILSYVSAIAVPMAFATPVSERFGISHLVATLILSVVAMFAVSIVFGGIRKLALRPQIPKKVEGKAMPVPAVPSLSGPSRFLGGFLGGLCGIAVTSVVGWCYDLACTGPMGNLLPDSTTSMTTRVSQNVMYGAVYAATRQVTDSAGSARIVAALISHPSKSFNGVNWLMSDPDIQKLVKDQTFTAPFLAAETETLAQHQGLKSILNDATTLQTLASMGLLPDGDASNVPDGLAIVGGKIGTLINDTDVQEAAKGLQADGLLAEGKTTQLICDSRFLTIMDRVTGGWSRSPTDDFDMPPETDVQSRP